MVSKIIKGIYGGNKNKMKKTLIKEEYWGWEDECVYCFTKIKGRTPLQVQSRMSLHQKSKNCEFKKQKAQLNKQMEEKQNG